MNKDAYYFPHFSNARQDRKLKRAMKQLGIEGYAIYFMLLEVLRDQSQLKYPMEDIDLLADEFGTSEQKVRTIICNYGLFQVDDEEYFFSPKFFEYLSPYLEQKERNRLNGIKGNLIKYGKATKEQLREMSKDEIMALNVQEAVIVGGESGGESGGGRLAVAKKEKKSKLKESKVNQSIYIAPTISEVEEYFKSKDKIQSSHISLEAENFINHYESLEWKKNGKKIKNWKLQASTWANNYVKFNPVKRNIHDNPFD